MLNEALTNKIDSKLVPITHALYTILFMLILYSTKIDIVKLIYKYALAISIITMVLFIYEFILYRISAKKIKDSDSPATVDELIKQSYNSNGKGIKFDLNVTMYSELHDQAIFNIVKLGIINVSPLILMVVKVHLAYYSSLFFEIVGWFTLIVFIYLVFSTIHSVLSSTWLFVKCKTTIVSAEYVGKVQARSDSKEDKKDEKWVYNYSSNI